jgi:hypothetical protein
MVVTSGVIPIPSAWTALPKITVAVSVDGNPEDHDVRRKPATYERILKNIQGRKVNIHWTVVRKNTEDAAYMDRYLAFWNGRPEVNRIWVSVYTPQLDELSDERLTDYHRQQLATYFNSRAGRFAKLTMHSGLMKAFVEPPVDPSSCLFSKLSVNYTADLRTRVEPCVFGGTPSCADCGCSISMGMHWLGDTRIVGGLRARHLIEGSLAIGKRVNSLLSRNQLSRWENTLSSSINSDELVQIKQ